MKQSFSQIALKQSTINKMIELSWMSYPAEAIGLVSIDSDSAEALFPLKNLAPDRSFFADPYEQYLAFKEIANKGQTLIATFHSHPEGGAVLSDFDCKYVFEVAPIAIVLALRSYGNSVQIGAFRRVGDRIEKVHITAKT